MNQQIPDQGLDLPQQPREQVQPSGKRPSSKQWATPSNELPSSERVKRLPPGDGLGTSRVPFQVADRDAYLAMVREHGSVASKTHDAPIALVKLSDLIAIQNTINDERLVQHLDDPAMVPEGKRASGHGGLVDRPVVVRKDGVLYIHDGHHRLTAAQLRGQSTAKVRLVDLDGQYVRG